MKPTYRVLVLFFTLSIGHAQTIPLIKTDSMGKNALEKKSQEKIALEKNALEKKVTDNELTRSAEGKLKAGKDKLSDISQTKLSDLSQKGSNTVKNATHAYWQRVRKSLCFNKDSLFKLKPVAFFRFTSGQVTLLTQVGERTGAYPGTTPVTFTRFTFQGGFDLLGLPLKAHALYSTEQASTRQIMNQIGVNLDVARIQQLILTRINERIRELEQLSNPSQVKEVNQLLDFYQKNDLDISSGKELLELDSYEKMAKNTFSKDAISNSKEKLLQKGQDSLTHTKNNLIKSSQTKLEKKKQSVQDSLQTQLNQKKQARIEKRAKRKQARKAKQRAKHSQKHSSTDSTYSKNTSDTTLAILREDVQQYRKTKLSQLKQALAKEKISLSDLSAWQKRKDSLQLNNPGRLVQLEEIAALKAIKNKDIKEGISVLQHYHLVPSSAPVLASIKTLGVGTNYPVYTPFTLRGVPVNGVMIELKPGLLYLAYTASKNMRAVEQQKTYARTIQAGRVGIGTQQGTHLFFTTLYGKDNNRSFQGDTIITGVIDTTVYNKPRENFVLGTEASWQLKTWVKLTGEWAYGVTAMNTYVQTLEKSKIFDYFGHTSIDPSDSTLRSGHALSLQLQVAPWKDTRLTIRTESIGAGYYSLGTPFLRNNIRGNEYKLEQYFLKRKIQIAPSYSLKHDQSQSDSESNQIESYGVKGVFSLSKLPRVMVNYLRTIVDGSYVYSLTQVTQFDISHSYKLGDTRMQSSVNWSGQKNDQLTKNQEDSGNQASFTQSSITQIRYTHLISFLFGLNLNGTLTYMEAEKVPTAGKWISYGASVSYTFRGRWQNSIGIEEGNNQTEGKKRNHFFDTKYNFTNKIAAAIRVEKNALQVEDKTYSYQETFGNLSLTVRF